MNVNVNVDFSQPVRLNHILWCHYLSKHRTLVLFQVLFRDMWILLLKWVILEMIFTSKYRSGFTMESPDGVSKVSLN